VPFFERGDRWRIRTEGAASLAESALLQAAAGMLVSGVFAYASGRAASDQKRSSAPCMRPISWALPGLPRGEPPAGAYGGLIQLRYLWCRSRSHASYCSSPRIVAGDERHAGRLEKPPHVLRRPPRFELLFILSGNCILRLIRILDPMNISLAQFALRRI